MSSDVIWVPSQFDPLVPLSVVALELDPPTDGGWPAYLAGFGIAVVILAINSRSRFDTPEERVRRNLQLHLDLMDAMNVVVTKPELRRGGRGMRTSASRTRVWRSISLPVVLNILESGRSKRASIFMAKDGELLKQEYPLKVGRSFQELHRMAYAYTQDEYSGEGWQGPNVVASES